MVDIATVCNARIYVHPARRREDDIRKMMALLIGENIALGKHNLSWLYRHACWLNKWTDKLRIIDIDDDKWVPLWMIRETIRMCQPNIWTDKVVNLLPTKNWKHFITTPFNIEEFKLAHPTIDVHKNNPTILFIP